jgi:hypothetical protein
MWIVLSKLSLENLYYTNVPVYNRLLVICRQINHGTFKSP